MRVILVLLIGLFLAGCSPHPDPEPEMRSGSWRDPITVDAGDVEVVEWTGAFGRGWTATVVSLENVNPSIDLYIRVAGSAATHAPLLYEGDSWTNKTSDDLGLNVILANPTGSPQTSNGGSYVLYLDP